MQGAVQAAVLGPPFFFFGTHLLALRELRERASHTSYALLSWPPGETRSSAKGVTKGASLSLAIYRRPGLEPAAARRRAAARARGRRESGDARRLPHYVRQGHVGLRMQLHSGSVLTFFVRIIVFT